MLTGHLGARSDELVDGRLSDEEREIALAHLMGCSRCQDEVGQLRQLKLLLAGADAAPPPDLVLGLSAMRQLADTDPYADLPPSVPARPRPVLGEIGVHGWRGTLVAGAVTLVGASAVTLMLVAPGPTRPAQPSPSASFTVTRTGGGSMDADMGAGVTASLRTRP